MKLLLTVMFIALVTIGNGQLVIDGKVDSGLLKNYKPYIIKVRPGFSVPNIYIKEDSIIIWDSLGAIKELLEALKTCQSEQEELWKMIKLKSSNLSYANFNIVGQAKIGDKFDMNSDTLIASRFLSDSLGRTFEIEYRYVENKSDTIKGDSWHLNKNSESSYHTHYIALVTIISFKGNKRKIIAENIKSIYSPVDCSADCPALWLKRLYQILNKK